MVIIRIAIGLVFLLSGFEKVIAPYQNFLYAIEAYQLFPSAIERVIAQIFPWLELFIGLFLVLGLWTSWMLRAAMCTFAGFILIVGQALIRGLNLENCGCFGEFIHIQPRVIIVMDSLMLLATIISLRFIGASQRFSLDKKMS